MANTGKVESEARRLYRLFRKHGVRPTREHEDRNGMCCPLGVVFREKGRRYSVITSQKTAREDQMEAGFMQSPFFPGDQSGAAYRIGLRVAELAGLEPPPPKKPCRAKKRTKAVRK